MAPVEPSTPVPRSTSRARIVVDDRLWFDAREITWRFTPSGGPGGQHANRTHTRAEVELDLAASPSLDDATRARLVRRLGPVVRISADEHRSQRRNRDEALGRLVAVLAEANHVPRTRRPTRPGRGATERRLTAKREHSERKASRRKPDAHD